MIQKIRFYESQWLQVKQRTFSNLYQIWNSFTKKCRLTYTEFLPRSPIKNLQTIGRGHLYLGTVQRRNWEIWTGTGKLAIRENRCYGSQTCKARRAADVRGWPAWFRPAESSRYRKTVEPGARERVLREGSGGGRKKATEQEGGEDVDRDLRGLLNFWCLRVHSEH